jgi:YidC/Oxa1 family membrane protein insertase
MYAFTIPGLEWLSKAIAYLLHWLAAVTGGSYGVAIVLLTVLMRLAILPLSIKQTKSMIAMQQLQPQLKEIQKKYKDDREKQGQEMMKLYKENKVSPLGGCLPLLLQLPILFAMFDVLNSLSNPKSAYFSILFPGQTPPKTTAAINKWVASAPQLQFLGMNITYSGQKLWSSGDYVHIIVLILLTVVTGYISAKMMTTDPKQSKLMAMMPVMMGVFAWILPAGVTIYIIVTNIITIVQQYVQLEHDGFYDEKLAEIRKLGHEASWHKRWYLRGMEFGTKVLIAVRLRPKPKPKSKKEAAGEGKPAGKSKTAAVAKKPGEKRASAPGEGKPKAGAPPAKKKPSAPKQQGQVRGEKSASGGKPSSKTPPKKAISKDYPAKKKGTGKK